MGEFLLGCVATLVLITELIVPTLRADVVVTGFKKGYIELTYTDLIGNTRTLEVDSTVALQLPDYAYRYGVKETCE